MEIYDDSASEMKKKKWGRWKNDGGESFARKTSSPSRVCDIRCSEYFKIKMQSIRNPLEQ